MGAKDKKKADKEKKKDEKKAKKKAKADEAEDASDSEPETATEEPAAAAAVADESTAAVADEDDGDEAFSDDDDSGSSSGRCKHAAKCIKAQSVRGLLKTLPKTIEAARKSKGAADAKSKSKSSKVKDQPAMWLCTVCGQLDAPVDHFSKKHAVGIDLFSMDWRCFPCESELLESSVESKGLTKMRLVTQLIESAVGSSARKASAAATAGAIKSGRESAAAAAQQEAAASSAAAASSYAPSSGIVVRGLRNLGNTCFFNSVMQGIAATVPLYGTLIYPSSSLYDSNAISHAHPLQLALLHFLQSMQAAPKASPPPPPPPVPSKKQKYMSAPKDESRVVVPSGLLNAVQAINPMFRGNRQHDSHELLRTILNGICLEKEEAQRKKQQAAAAKVISGWSCEQVLQWVASFGLSCEEVVTTNLLTDPDHKWDGNFLLFLLENWNGKSGKKPRIVLHAGVTAMEDKRLIARNLQRIKDGILPDPRIFGYSKEAEAQRQAEQDKKDAEAAALHPFESLLQSTFIHSLFGGVSRNTVECCVCNTISTTHEYFLDLSLAIDAPRAPPVRPASTAVSAALSFAAAAGAAASPAKKPTPAGQSAGAIAKKSNSKRMTKQARKDAKRKQKRSGSKAAGGSAPTTDGEEDEDGEEEAAEDGAEAPAAAEGEKKEDDAAAPTEQNAPAADSAAAASATDAVDAAPAAAAPVVDPAASTDTPSTSVTADSVDSLSNDVAQLAIAPVAAAPVPETTAAAAVSPGEKLESTSEAAPAAAAATETPVTPAVDAPAVAAASASSAMTAAASSSSASAASSSASGLSSAAAAFLVYLRTHRLGLENRLHATKDHTLSIADCLGAYTDPDLLTGNNRYGCKECSRRAQEAGLAAPSIASRASPLPPTVQNAAASPATPAASPAVPSPAEPSSSVAVAVDASPSQSASDSAALPASLEPVAADPASSDKLPAWDSDESKEDGAAASSSSAAAAASSSADGTAAADAASPPVDESFQAPAEPSPPPPPVWVKQDAIKRSRILVPPTILTLHLKRFHHHGRSLEKSSKAVSFPLCFNLAPFMTSASPPSFAAEGAHFDPLATPEQNAGDKVPPVWYHLYGIVNHGGGMGGGHYVSMTRRQNIAEACERDALPSTHGPECCGADAAELCANWFFQSDSDVRAITAAEALRTQAYILFYQRV